MKIRTSSGGVVKSEVDPRIADLQSQIDGLSGFRFIVIRSDELPCTIAANNGVPFIFTWNIPEGYKALCMAGYSVAGPTGAINAYSTSKIAEVIFGKTGTQSCEVWFRNYSDEEKSAGIYITLLCVKD